MSHVSDLLHGIAQMLDDAAVATYRSDGSAYLPGETAVFFKNMPADPDRVVVLSTYGANSDQPEITLGRQPVQVKVRGNLTPATDVDDIADAIFDVLHGATDLTFGAMHVVQILRESNMPMPMDAQSRRWLRSDNYYLDVDYPVSANRPI